MRKRPNLIVRNSGVVGLIHNTGLSTTVSMFYSFIVDIYTNHSSCRPLAFKYQLPVQWPQFRLSFNRSYHMRFTSYLIASRFTNFTQIAECVHSRLRVDLDRRNAFIQSLPISPCKRHTVFLLMQNIDLSAVRRCVLTFSEYAVNIVTRFANVNVNKVDIFYGIVLIPLAYCSFRCSISFY